MVLQFCQSREENIFWLTLNQLNFYKLVFLRAHITFYIVDWIYLSIWNVSRPRGRLNLKAQMAALPERKWNTSVCKIHGKCFVVENVYYIILSGKRTQNGIYALIIVMYILFNIWTKTGKKENRWHIVEMLVSIPFSFLF